MTRIVAKDAIKQSATSQRILSRLIYLLMHLGLELRFKLSAIGRKFLRLAVPSLALLLFISHVSPAEAQIFPSPGEDPLLTRCMPRSPCLSVGEGIKSWDEDLRQKLLFDEDLASVKSIIETMTESSLGIILLSVFLILFVVIVWKTKTSVSAKRWFTKGFQLVIGLLISNEFSVLLKLFFGRLKPHVSFYNPHVIPALSFPSSHAFNTAFLCVFLYLSIVKSTDFELRVKSAGKLLNIYLVLYAFGIAWGRHFVQLVSAG